MASAEALRALTESAIEAAAFAVEALAAALIVATTLHALARAAAIVARERRLPTSKEQSALRMDYVRRLVFSLEFLVAGDLLRTIVAPTLTSIGIVGAVIVVRTVLALALEHELQLEATRKNQGGADESL